jgi:isochorismate synthase
VKGVPEIDTLIRQNRTFAVYRLPGEDHLHFIEPAKGSARIIHAITLLNEQNGFVIAPFCVSEKCPIILIETEEESVFDIPDIIMSNNEEKNIILFLKLLRIKNLKN